jgi:hypothetical protein
MENMSIKQTSILILPRPDLKPETEPREIPLIKIQ